MSRPLRRAAAGIALALFAAACSSGSAARDPFLHGSPALATSGPVQVAIMGDSLALTLGIGLSGGQAVYNLHIVDYGDLGCGIAGGQPIQIAGTEDAYQPGMPAPEPDTPPDCPRFAQYWQKDVNTAQPDVSVILVGRWETVNRMHDGQWMNIGQPAYDDYLSAQIEKAVAVGASRGARVVLLTMPYLAPTYGNGSLSPSAGPQDPESLPQRVDQFNALLRKVAAHYPGWVSVVDLNAMLDPNGSYTSQLGPVTTRNLTDAAGNPDGSHISPAGGELVAPKILPVLARLGVLARRGG